MDCNINTNNNTLVLTDKTGTNTTFTITPGNYTVSSFMIALNTAVQAATTAAFKGIVVTYSDFTNRYKFSHSLSYFQLLVSTSTVNAVLGFETGEINSTLVPTTFSTPTATIAHQIIITDFHKSFNFSYDGTPCTVTCTPFTRTCSDIATNILSFICL